MLLQTRLELDCWAPSCEEIDADIDTDTGDVDRDNENDACDKMKGDDVWRWSRTMVREEKNNSEQSRTERANNADDEDRQEMMSLGTCRLLCVSPRARLDCELNSNGSALCCPSCGT